MSTTRHFFRVICAILLMSAPALQAQLPEDDEDIKEIEFAINNGPPPARGYRMMLGASVHAPHILFNPANARAFDAIVGTALNVHFKVWKNVYVGTHFEYDGFVIYRPIFNQPNLTNSQFFGMGSVKYVKIWPSGIGFIPAVRAGMGYIHYAGIFDANTGTRTLNDVGFATQGEVGLYYFPFENQQAGMGLKVGGTYFSHEFKKTDMNLEGDDALTFKSDVGNTFHLSIGFSFVFNLGKMY